MSNEQVTVEWVTGAIDNVKEMVEALPVADDYEGEHLGEAFHCLSGAVAALVRYEERKVK